MIFSKGVQSFQKVNLIIDLIIVSGAIQDVFRYIVGQTTVTMVPEVVNFTIKLASNVASVVDEVYRSLIVII